MSEQVHKIVFNLSKEQATTQAKEFWSGEKQRVKQSASSYAEAEKIKTQKLREEVANRKNADKQARREEVTSAKQAEREKADAAKAAMREWKQGMAIQHRQAMQQWKEQQKGAFDVGGAITDAAASVATFGLGMLGLSSANAVISTISDNWKQIKQNVIDATGVLQGYRESLLELAALKGNMGESGKELVDNLRFRAQTGQKAQESIALQEAAVGVGGGSVDAKDAAGNPILKNISEDEFKKAQVFGGKMQAVEGGNATSYGRMVGSLPRLMGERQDAESVKEQMGRMYEIMKPGGYSMSSGMHQFGQGAPYISSGMLSVDETAALQSMYSVDTPDEAGTRLDQLMRATVGSLNRNRKVKGVEGSDHVGTATYLKGLGAKDGMKPQEIAMLIKADLDREKADKGADFNPMGYLQGKGYGNQEDLLSLVNFDTKRWQDTYAPMLANKDLGKAGTKAVEDRLVNDQTFVTRRGQYSEELGKMAPGVGSENMVALQRAAYGNLKGRNGGKDFAAMPDFEKAINPGLTDDWWTGYGGKIKEEASDILEGEAAKYGVQAKRPMRAVGNSGTLIKDNYSDEEMSRISNEVRSKGGLTLQDGVNKLVEQNTKLIELAEKRNEIAKDQVKPAPLGNGAPRQMPRRP